MSASLGARQHGVVALTQLLEAGVTAPTVRYWVQRRRLVRLHAGVYAVGHAALRPEGHRLAAVLACGPGAVLSHASAAAHWRIRRSAASRAPRWRAHCSTSRPSSAVAVSTRRSRRASASSSWTCGKWQSFSGGIGAGAAAAGCVGRSPALTRSSSACAARPRRASIACALRPGLPRPLVNRIVGEGECSYEADLHWPDARVILEVDSHYHDTAAAKVRDRARDRALRGQGWSTLRGRDDGPSAPLIAELRRLVVGARRA
jgi:hypothetical protein